MDEDKTGGPAFRSIESRGGPMFPQTIKGDHGAELFYYGATLLDFFAGQALAAARINVSTDVGYAEAYAKSAYDFAEAMLAEKAKREASNDRD